MKLIFIFCLFITICLGCSKLNDSEKPSINILSPKTNDTIPANSMEVNLQFTATDNTGLASVRLGIKDANGENYFTDSKEIQGKEYSYKNSFVIISHPSKIKSLIFSIQLTDNNKNESVTNTTFHIAPSK